MRTFINGENGLTILDHWQPNCWINIECPTLEELNYLTEELHIPQSFLNDIEDPDERPRIELEDDWKIIIIRIPIPPAGTCRFSLCPWASSCGGM